MMVETKRTAKPLIVVVICVVIIVSVCIGFMYPTLCEYYRIPDFSDNGNVVYTPQAVRLPVEFHNEIFCIDTYMHWVYKLNSDEHKEILEDIETGNWTLMDDNLFNEVKEFDGFYGYKHILKNTLKKHECYVCVYDSNNDEIITTQSDYFISENNNYRSKWVIFLYDTETCKYYCIYATI